MIAALIRWSVGNRFLVLMATLFVVAVGQLRSVATTPLDALPDLSDTQVIVRTTYPGQAPQVVEDQVTYPLTTTMLSVPGAKTVRGYSFFGDSYVYVLFDDGTDLYWARSRVLEYLNQVQRRCRPARAPSLGPDATGVGWIYEYALVDRSGKHDLAQLRALQDWFLRYELKTRAGRRRGRQHRRHGPAVPGRARSRPAAPPTASRQARSVDAVQSANQEAGGSVLELGEAEYMVRARGYLTTLDDFRAIPLRAGATACRSCCGDVARVQIGPGDAARHRRARRRGRGRRRRRRPALRQERAATTIAAVKAKLDELKASLPAGGRGRHHLRPLAADRPRRREPAPASCSRSSSSSRWSACCSSGTCARRWWPSSPCRWACWSPSS